MSNPEWCVSNQRRHTAFNLLLWIIALIANVLFEKKSSSACLLNKEDLWGHCCQPFHWSCDAASSEEELVDSYSYQCCCWRPSMVKRTASYGQNRWYRQMLINNNVYTKGHKSEMEAVMWFYVLWVPWCILYILCVLEFGNNNQSKEILAQWLRYYKANFSSNHISL